MKKALLMLALPLVQVASAQAYAGDDAVTPHPTKTRMDVREELTAAQSSGEWQAGEAGPATIFYRKPPIGTATRLQVRNDTKTAARAGQLPKAGEIAIVDGIDTKSGSTRSRAEVRAETQLAIKDRASDNRSNSYAGN